MTVPVRGLDTDLHPHAAEINRTYFADYAHGHPPAALAPDPGNNARIITA